jgi:hypothetical protein
MTNLIIGIAVGAAFSKFWLMVWNYGKTFAVAFLAKFKADSAPKA